MDNDYKSVTALLSSKHMQEGTRKLIKDMKLFKNKWALPLNKYSPLVSAFPPIDKHTFTLQLGNKLNPIQFKLQFS